MNIPPFDRMVPILFALLLAACSSRESDQQTVAMAAVATARTAPASSTSAPMMRPAPATSDTAAPDQAGAQPAMPVTTDEPAAAQSAAGTAMPEPPAPPTAIPNQADQAALARQSEAAMDVPGTEPAAPSEVNTQTTATTPATSIGTGHGTSPQSAHAAVMTHLGHHAPPLATQLATTAAAHPPAHTMLQQDKALRQARFTSLASRFHRPVLISSHDTQASPPKVMSLKLGSVGISNFDDTTRVNFALKTFENDWANDFIEPRDTREFGCGILGDCLFWMQTGDKSPVYYTMHHDHRYAIFWDPKKGIWDLRLASQDP